MCDRRAPLPPPPTTTTLATPLQVFLGSIAMVQASTFTDNRALLGAGVAIGAGSNVTLDGAAFKDNVVVDPVTGATYQENLLVG